MQAQPIKGIGDTLVSWSCLVTDLCDIYVILLLRDAPCMALWPLEDLFNFELP